MFLYTCSLHTFTHKSYYLFYDTRFLCLCVCVLLSVSPPPSVSLSHSLSHFTH